MYEFNKMQGKDRFGWIFLQTAVDMAIELGLFHRSNTDDMSADERSYSRSFTAWSVFIYQAYVERGFPCALALSTALTLLA